jgi:hypothetical protein
MPAIVNVNVTLTQAPTPNTLQGTGAFISQGGTNTAPGTKTLLTQMSTLSTYLNGNKAITSITQTTGTATVTTTAAHGFAIADTIWLTISGATQTGYDGSFLCTITTTTAFTYAVPSGTVTPATTTTTFTYTEEDVGELNAMNTTFFAQGGSKAVYVLELGPGSVNEGVASLTTWIAANPPGVAYGSGFYGFYGYLVPRTWDGNANFITLLASYESTTALTYFWITTTLATYTLYPATAKCAVLFIESPNLAVYPANALTAIAESGTVVTAATTTAHGVAAGDWFQVSGCVPTGYNGWWQAQVGTTGTALVWNAPSGLGSETTLGTLLANQYANTFNPTSEFSWASGFFVTLNYNPSATNQVTQFEYAFTFGVTPFPVLGMSALLTTLKTANVNVMGTGAEGGLSGTMIVGGNTLDGNSFNFWYAIDWMNVNINLNVSNYIINGSNNPSAPVYYNQPGINGGQAVGAGTITSAISYGMCYGSLLQTELSSTQFAANVAAGIYNGYAVINAIPAATYAQVNPSAYKLRSYGGYAVSFAPQLGFDNVTFNLNATTFVGQG